MGILEKIMAKEKVEKKQSLEKTLWAAADKLIGSAMPQDYIKIVLGLIFLKYVSDRFDAKYKQLVEDGDGFEEEKLIDDINDDHFKACLDTGHVNCFETRNLGDAVRILGNDLKVLHVHDNRFGRDSHDLPYFGSADWDSFYEGLKDVGYNGVFNLETSPPWKLGEELYDEMAKLLVKIAKKIIHYDE